MTRIAGVVTDGPKPGVLVEISALAVFGES